MKKYPFTNAGMQELTAVLYRLPDPELQAEAGALLLDFQSWMIKHFELAEKQIIYLKDMDDEVVAFTAWSTSFAVENRLAVLLDKEEPEEPIIWKIVRPEARLAVSTSSKDRFKAEGEVIIHISYKK